MRMRKTVAASVVLAALFCAPSAARADILLTPFLGTTFGAGVPNEHLSFGGSLAFMGGGVVGFEVDFGYTPEFFAGDDQDFDLSSDSNITTLMGNLIIGVPIGGDDASVRPYVTGGGGLMRSSLSASDLFDNFSSNDFGVNVGGGAHVFVNDNVGFRGDVRYFRSVSDTEGGDGIDFDFGELDFWRATGGVTFKF